MEFKPDESTSLSSKASLNKSSFYISVKPISTILEKPSRLSDNGTTQTSKTPSNSSSFDRIRLGCYPDSVAVDHV